MSTVFMVYCVIGQLEGEAPYVAAVCPSRELAERRVAWYIRCLVRDGVRPATYRIEQAPWREDQPED